MVKMLYYSSFIMLCLLGNIVFAAGDMNGNRNIRQVHHEKLSFGPSHVEFSPDGRLFLAFVSHAPLYVWYVDGFKTYKDFWFSDIEKLTPENDQIEQAPARKKPDEIVGANFSPDSRSVFLGFDNGTAMMINLETGRQKTYTLLKKEQRARISAVSRSGNILVLGDGYFDKPRNRKVLGNPPPSQNGLEITTDDKYLLVSSYHLASVGVYDIAGGNFKRWLQKSAFYVQNVTGISVSPDNDTVAVGLVNGDINVYSIRKDGRIKNLSHGGEDAKVRFSPDGKTLLSVSDNKRACLWDAATWDKKTTWETPGVVTTMKWLQGKPWIAFGTAEGELVIKSTDREETVYRRQITKDDRIMEMDYLPSRHLLLLSSEGGHIYVFKIE